MATLSHNELKAIRNRDRNYSVKELKRVESSEIDAHVSEFLARGGMIKEIPSGLSGEFTSMPPFSPSMAMIKARDDGMSLKSISLMLGRSHAWILKQIQMGSGPRFTLDAKKRKRFEKREVLAWHESMK